MQVKYKYQAIKKKKKEGRKTDRDHKPKALLLNRVQDLTRDSLARDRREVTDLCKLEGQQMYMVKNSKHTNDEQ